MIFFILVNDQAAAPSDRCPRRASHHELRERLRARWDAAVPTLVAIGMGLLAWLGVAFSGARPS